MIGVQTPDGSKVVQGVGIFLIVMGILEATYTFALITRVLPPTRSDLLPFTLPFLPVLISCGVGIGILLRKRWALFAWLGLTGVAFFELLVDLAVSIKSPFARFEVMRAVIPPAFVTALFMGIPAYLLWKRRNLFAGTADAARHKP